VRHFCFESELSVFLFFLHLRCSNVCTYAAVRLRDGPAQTTTLTVVCPSQLQTAHTQQRGLEWEGRKSQQLSLWLRLDSQGSRSPHSHVSKQQGAHK
jgi:hypothetical protein